MWSFKTSSSLCCKVFPTSNSLRTGAFFHLAQTSQRKSPRTTQRFRFGAGQGRLSSSEVRTWAAILAPGVDWDPWRIVTREIPGKSLRSQEPETNLSSPCFQVK